MIAADRRRIGARVTAASRRVDRLANRGLERAYPPLRRGAALLAPVLTLLWAALHRAAAFAWRALRPALALFFRALAAGEVAVRAAAGAAPRGATRASAALTPRRVLAASIAGAGAALIASQFLDYHGVLLGQAAGYAGLPHVVAEPPAVDLERAGAAHAWLLVPVGVLAIGCGALATRRNGSRAALGAALLGAVALAVVLLVDLHQAHEVGTVSARFAGAHAVLRQGFYAELAAAAALLATGLLYYARPCLIRISSSGRAASARRRRPRRPASSRARVARSA